MNSVYYAFILSFFAGLSTVLGALVIFTSKKTNSSIVVCSLAFAAGVMICVSILDLIPTAFSTFFYNDIFFKVLLVLIFIVCGIIISMLIDKYVPDNYNSQNSNLYKIGIISMLAIILHNIPEGITTFISTKTDISLGLSLSIAIALHNIPEGISIAIPIYYSTNSKLRAVLYTTISGFSEFIGAVLAYLFIAKYVNNFMLAMILAITAGIMIHISSYELLPSSFSYKKTSLTFISFMCGFLVMLVCDFIF